MAFIQSSSSTTGSTTSTTPTFTSTSGNTIFAVAGVSGNSTTGVFDSVTDNKGNTYTKAVGLIITTASGNGTEIWYSQNITGGAGHTVTCTRTTPGDGGVVRVHIQEWSNIAVSPLDQTASQTNASGTPTSGNTATTTQANEVLIGSDGSNASDTGAGSGYSNYLNSLPAGHGVSMESQAVSSTGAYAATFTSGAAVTYAACIATFKVSTVVPGAPAIFFTNN